MECTAAARNSESQYPQLRAYRGAGNRRPLLNELLETKARRMAQSLHDDAGQLLAVVYLKLDELTGRLSEPQRSRIGDLRSKLSEFESGLRRLSHELRPMILEDFGLIPAVHFLRQGITDRTGLAISVTGSLRGRLAPSVETAVYRIVHEALWMAIQGGARKVQISFLRHGGRVACSIRMEGADGRSGEAAMRAIRERVADLEGSFVSCAVPNGDFTMAVGIPVD